MKLVMYSVFDLNTAGLVIFSSRISEGEVNCYINKQLIGRFSKQCDFV